jgi:2'-5' RNA ligase
MPRVRFGVALLVPPPFDREIDGLRRACGDRQIRRVPPHITLVPPVNVRVDDVPAALRVLREAAAETAPSLELAIGPPKSFAPDTDSVYLAVTGEPEVIGALGALRDRVFRAPLWRELDWPFVPHVTIADVAEPQRLGAMLAALADYRIVAEFGLVHLLEEQRDDVGHRRWVPVADARFARPAIVGRGGYELELTRSSLRDPEVIAFEHTHWEVLGRPAPALVCPAGGEPVVITARRRGIVVGSLHGWLRDDGAEIASTIVDAAVRGVGIGRHLRLAFEWAEALWRAEADIDDPAASARWPATR